MLKSGNYSDLTITNSRQQRSWKVHKAIVCARSPFFAACIRNRFKEAQDNVIDLLEDDPKHIDYVLQYLYTYDLDTAKFALTSQEKGSLIADADAFRLFALADRLELGLLKSYWNNVLLERAQKLPRVTFDQQYGSSSYQGLLTDSPKKREDINQVVQFVQNCYDTENPGIEAVRAATVQRVITDTPSKELSSGNSRASLLHHMLNETIVSKPQLGMDLVKGLAASKKNQPIVELLKYEAMSDMMLSDQKVMLNLVNSLAVSRNY